MNNKWFRNLFINTLRKYCNIYKIKLVEVNPTYSSVIGNIQYCKEYNMPDMIELSIELARRGYKKFEKEWFYPYLDIVKICRLNQRKEGNLQWVFTWRELYIKIKDMKLMYWVQLDDLIIDAVFSKNNKKSKTYNFGTKFDIINKGVY